MWIAQLDKEQNFAYDVDKAARGNLERHVLNTADEVASFDREEGYVNQIRSGTCI